MCDTVVARECSFTDAADLNARNRFGDLYHGFISGVDKLGNLDAAVVLLDGLKTGEPDGFGVFGLLAQQRIDNRAKAQASVYTVKGVQIDISKQLTYQAAGLKLSVVLIVARVSIGLLVNRYQRKRACKGGKQYSECKHCSNQRKLKATLLSKGNGLICLGDDIRVNIAYQLI